MLMTVPEVAAVLRCKRTRVFDLLASGVLVRGARYGRQTVITRESVEAALQVPEAPDSTKRYRTRKDLNAAADAVLADLRAGRI